MAGSGKSYTMFGVPGNDGVIARAIDDVFATAKKRSKKWDFVLKASILELYEEELTDLLNPGTKKLSVRRDVKGVVHVVNASFTPLSSTDLLKECITKALKKRDELGHDTSNSNVFVTVTVECSNKETGVINNGRLVFSDLVGCNKGHASMDALEEVIKALEAERQEIPYTACGLTRLFNDCLGGNSKTLVLVHVKADADLWEETKKVWLSIQPLSKNLCLFLLLLF